jgi:hypothetical protein
MMPVMCRWFGRRISKSSSRACEDIDAKLPAKKTLTECAAPASDNEAVKYLCAVFLAGACFAAAPVDLTPRVGAIEVYGARKVPVSKIEKALGVKTGDILPSREQAEDRINKVGNILVSRVEAACCSGGHGVILYVGVEERDAPRMEFHPVPTGNLFLADSVIENYRRLLDEVESSMRAQNADEDLTNGYSLMADPECRSIQNSFLKAVALDFPNISEVVRQSSNPEQRAAAAYLLQYAPRTPHNIPVMINGIQWALQDDDDIVRDSAMTSLRAVLVGAKLHPEQEIHFEATWLVELMNSVVWSDRFHASQALVNLTDDKNQAALDLLRSRALRSVIEMARWHDLKHALPAFILAGRLAGMDDTQIKQAWVNEDRESVLQAALGAHGKHAKAKA